MQRTRWRQITTMRYRQILDDDDDDNAGVTLAFCRLDWSEAGAPTGVSSQLLFTDCMTRLARVAECPRTMNTKTTWFNNTLCSEKNWNVFFVICSIKFGRFWWNLLRSFLNKFVAKPCKRFPPHLHNVSILPCEISNAHNKRATIELLEKESSQSILLQQCGLQVHQIWIQLITACGVHCKRRCTNTLIWMNWNRDWERSGPCWISWSLRQSLVSGVVAYHLVSRRSLDREKDALKISWK